jgi:hypothetical protein
MGIRGRRAFAALGVAATAIALVAAVPATSIAGERKQVITDYTLVRNGPHQLVIATAYRGDTVDVQQEQSGGYRWGRVHGGIDICAWTFGGALSQGPATQDACRHDPPRSVEGFTNGQIGSNPAGNDGAPAQFTPTAPGCNTYPDGSVPGYGNVKPWLVPAQPADQLANVSLTAADRVLWRYVSADGGWVMVRVPKFGSTDGAGTQGWMFIQRACLTW